MIVLDLETTIGLAGAVEDVTVAFASVRALRGMAHHERTELAARYLMPAEVARYDALAAFSKRQLEWLAGRLAVKRAVKAVVGRSAREIEIRQDGPTGRPYVDEPGVHVGISHSFDVALGAAAPHAIGLDVELVRPLPPELIDYAFDNSELDPLGADETAVVRLWTMKESFLKMLGLGVPAFDELQLISCETALPAWRTRGRVAEELGARQPRCWTTTAAGYAIALTWSVMQ